MHVHVYTVMYPIVFSARQFVIGVNVISVLFSSQPFVFSPPQVRVGVSAQTTTPLIPSTNKGTPPQLPQSALDALTKFKEAGEKMAAEDEANPEVVALSSDDEDSDDTSASAVNLSTLPKKKEAGKGEQKPLAVSEGLYYVVATTLAPGL